MPPDSSKYVYLINEEGNFEGDLPSPFDKHVLLRTCDVIDRRRLTCVVVGVWLLQQRFILAPVVRSTFLQIRNQHVDGGRTVSGRAGLRTGISIVKKKEGKAKKQTSGKRERKKEWKLLKPWNTIKEERKRERGELFLHHGEVKETQLQLTSKQTLAGWLADETHPLSPEKVFSIASFLSLNLIN